MHEIADCPHVMTEEEKEETHLMRLLPAVSTPGKGGGRRGILLKGITEGRKKGKKKGE